MPRASKAMRAANKMFKAGLAAKDGVSPSSRLESEDETLATISAEVSDRDITPPATSPGFEYARMRDDGEVTTANTERDDTDVEADIVPAEVEPPLPMDAFDNATSGEVAPLLRHDSNRHAHPHHHHHAHHVQQGLGLEESEPELFLNFNHFTEGGIPEHSTRGGVERSWGDFKRAEEQPQTQDLLFSPLPRESAVPETHVRGFSGFSRLVEEEEHHEIEQMEEELPEAETMTRRRSSVGRTVPLQMKVRGALRAVGKDFSNTFTDMRHQFADAVEHLMDNVGRKMAADEVSEQSAAQRCLKEGKMAEYHEHQSMANMCAAFSTICKNAVIHEAHAPPMLHPRSPLLSATQAQEESEHNLERSVPSSHADDSRDVSLQNRDFADDVDGEAQDIAESSTAHVDIPLGGAAEAEVRHAEPVVERVRHAADEIYSQLEQAAEDSVAELEHIMDVAEARQHVKALEFLAVGNEVSYHFREAASHAAAAISTLLHRAHEHSLPMTSSTAGSENSAQNAHTDDETENTNEVQNASPKSQSANFPVYPVPPTPTPSPASGYITSTF